MPPIIPDYGVPYRKQNDKGRLKTRCLFSDGLAGVRRGCGSAVQAVFADIARHLRRYQAVGKAAVADVL